MEPSRRRLADPPKGVSSHGLRSTVLGGLAAITIGTAGVLTLASAPASAADTPACVTKKEYRHIHMGMTKKRVHRIFDTRRSWLVDSGGGRYTRTYQSCDLHHAAWIEYKRIPNQPTEQRAGRTGPGLAEAGC